MGDFFKSFADFIKGIHPRAASQIAIGLWILLLVLFIQTAVAPFGPIELVLAIFTLAFIAALALTILARDGQIKGREADRALSESLEKRRGTIRGLRAVEKHVLYQFLFARRRKLVKIHGPACMQLVDIGVLRHSLEGGYVITDDYWDLLFDEGWDLLYEGAEVPGGKRPEWAEK